MPSRRTIAPDNAVIILTFVFGFLLQSLLFCANLFISAFPLFVVGLKGGREGTEGQSGETLEGWKGDFSTLVAEQGRRLSQFATHSVRRKG